MLKRFTLTIIVLGAVVIGVSAVAQAKMLSYIEPLDGDWGEQDDPFVVEQGQFNSGFFGRLTNDEDIDALALMIDAPLAEETISFVITVPECGDRFVDFYPAMALIGPGLEVPDDETLEALPFDLPEDMGVVLMIDETRPDPEQEVRLTGEAYTGQVYGDHVMVEIEIADEGEYTLAVWEPDGYVGAYALYTTANHPDRAELFPSEAQMRADNRLIETGEWMGWDCAAPN
jgi:hypothetical protein